MTDPLVTPEWLSDNLDRVSVLDCTYFLPPDPARSRSEFETARIPGAQLFEIDTVAAGNTDLPHMLPDEETFAAAMSALGIDGTRPVVVYDRSAIHFSAPRVWFTLTLFGLSEVFVLDGGLSAWRDAGHPVTSGPANRAAPAPVRDWTFDSSRVLDANDVLDVLSKTPSLVIDARAADRFAGRAPEPRPGLRSGRMPGSSNQPFNELTQSDGRFASADQLARTFAAFTAESPVVTCGSGMTACTLALGLARIGVDARLYDGSWAEWGIPGPLPVESDA